MSISLSSFKILASKVTSTIGSKADVAVTPVTLKSIRKDLDQVALATKRLEDQALSFAIQSVAIEAFMNSSPVHAAALAKALMQVQEAMTLRAAA